MTNYKGFSQQDLRDRQSALYKEYLENDKCNHEIIDEIERIADILDLGAPEDKK